MFRSRLRRPHADAAFIFGAAAASPGRSPTAPEQPARRPDSTYYYQSHRSASAIELEQKIVLRLHERVVVEITASGQESVLYSFNASAGDGFRPSSGVIQAGDGDLYGTTPGNGTDVNKSYGAVYKVTLSGQETLVYTFRGLTVADGQLPVGGLIQGIDGSLYGSTSEGGSGVSGTVFQLTPTGTETVLSNFNAGGNASLNGYSPIGSLIQASDGNLYGFNNLGGSYNGGTLFQVTPQGVTTVVYAFGATSGDGVGPMATLIQASDGNFYGTTHGGGAHGYGTIFKITPQ